MAEDIQKLIRQEAIAPTEIGRSSPQYQASEFQGGGVVAAQGPALPAFSDDEIKYKNLAAIAGGLGQSIDIFTNIAQTVDKETLEDVRAKFNQLEAEEIDPREKLRRFTEIADNTRTIIASDSWETNMKAEASKRFGKKALNEYATERFKEDALNDIDFRGDIEDEEFLGRFLPKWKTKNPTLTGTEPIKILDGKLLSQAREHDRKLFVISLVESYKNELNISEELSKGLMTGSVTIDDPRFSPQFVELWNSAEIKHNFSDFQGFANSRIIKSLGSLPNAETLPPAQLQLMAKSIMTEIQPGLDSIWDIKTNVSLEQARQVKNAVYASIVQSAIKSPSAANILKLVKAPSENLVAKNPEEAFKFATSYGSALWETFPKTVPGWTSFSAKEKQDWWSKSLEAGLKQNWVFGNVTKVENAIEFAQNFAQTTVNGQPQLINMYATDNVKQYLHTSTGREVTKMGISLVEPLDAWDNVVKDTLKVYTGSEIEIANPAVLASLKEILFDEVKDAAGTLLGVTPSSKNSDEKLEEWKRKYPDQYQYLEEQGFTLTRETLDSLRESWEAISEKHTQVAAALAKESKSAGGVDPKHFSERGIREETLENLPKTMERYDAYLRSKQTGAAVPLEVQQTGDMLWRLDASFKAMIDLGAGSTLLSMGEPQIAKQAELLGVSIENLKGAIQNFQNSTTEQQAAILKDENAVFTRAKNTIVETTFGQKSYLQTDIGRTLFPEFLRETGGKPTAVLDIAKQIEQKMNQVEPYSDEYEALHKQLNIHFAAWEFYVRELGSVSTSTENEALRGIVVDVLPILRSHSFTDLIEEGRNAEATMLMVATRALADTPALSATWGGPDQDDYKYARLIGSTLRGMPSVLNPEYMTNENKRVLGVLFSTLAGTDQEALQKPVPHRLIDMMKVGGRNDAITKSDIAGFALRKIIQEGPSREQPKLLAYLLTGDESLLSASKGEETLALKTFINSMGYELGGIPLINAEGADTFSFHGKTGDNALVEVIVDALKKSNNPMALTNFIQTGVTFATSGLSSRDIGAGWHLVLGSSGPSEGSQILYSTKRSQDGVSNLASTTRHISPTSPNFGIRATMARVSLSGDVQQRPDGKPGYFPTGMPQTIPFNDTYSNVLISTSNARFSSFSDDLFGTQSSSAQLAAPEISKITLEDIDDAFEDKFKFEGPNTFHSTLVDEISPEQGLIVSMLSLPANSENIETASTMFGIPFDATKAEAFFKAHEQASVMDYLSVSLTTGSIDELDRQQGSLMTQYVLPYFEKSVRLQQQSDGPRQQQKLFIQPIGPMYLDQSESTVLKTKRLSLDVNGFQQRPSFLSDVHSLAGQQQRARLQMTLLRIADWQEGRGAVGDPHPRILPEIYEEPKKQTKRKVTEE